MDPQTSVAIYMIGHFTSVFLFSIFMPFTMIQIVGGGGEVRTWRRKAALWLAYLNIAVAGLVTMYEVSMITG